MLQAAGGGISSSKDHQTRKTGEDIALAALSLQALSFASFTVLIIQFGRTAWDLPQGNCTKYRIKQFGGSRTTVMVTLVTCAAFLTRSVFRIIEYAGGYNGCVVLIPSSSLLSCVNEGCVEDTCKRTKSSVSKAFCVRHSVHTDQAHLVFLLDAVSFFVF